MMRGVRALVIASLLVTGCGSKQSGGPASGPGAVATVFPAARWVPAEPTYVVSAETMRDGQVAFTSFVDVLGMVLGFEVSEVGRELDGLLGVDPTSPDALAAIGVDLDGSMAVFSDEVNPTFVVHLSSPEQMLGFLEGQRQRGLRTQSVISAGVEVFTAKLASDAHISWAIDKDWLWVHFAFGGVDGVEWFESSKQPDGVGWVDGWKWARGLAEQAPALVGVFDLRGMLAKVAMRVPEAIACARQFDAVQRAGINFDGDLKRLATTISFDLGPASSRLASTMLMPPPGWAAASTNAPMAAQWNADLRAAAAWIQPCFGKVDAQGRAVPDGGTPDFVAQLDQYGIRSARGFVHSLDPDDKSGTGAVSADLSSSRFLRAQLDQIPGRSTFESSRTFGQYKGKRVSVPFVGKGDYVLNDQIVIASMGDGVLEKIGTGAAPASAPIMAIDLRPPGLSAGVWQFLFEQLDVNNPKRAAQRLLLWSELHVGARLEGSTLVIDAHGNRR